MQIHLIAVGTRMPAWVAAGWQEFARRLPGDCALRLVELPSGRRGRKADPVQARRDEGRRMLAALPPRAEVIALDVAGQPWSTPQLADELARWRQGGRDVALLAGGPDGLDDGCLARAERRWSLSPLTFPHMLVRVIVAEQLYRAWTVLGGHPYHRE